jgi:methyl-accepting chemotaxis protein
VEEYDLIRFRSIQFKILILIAAVGVILSTLLAAYSPWRARRLGLTILQNDARFTTGLLADNLALGIQTMAFDEGAALDQTLKLLQTGANGKWEAVSDVRIYDAGGKFVKGLHPGGGSFKPSASDSQMVVVREDPVFELRAPMRDADGGILGFLEVDFSKNFLNRQVARNSISALILSLTVFLVVLAFGLVIGRNVAGGIRKSVDVMKDIAQGEGDLTRRIRIDSEDEIGELQRWINEFMDKMHELVDRVRRNAEQVALMASAIGDTAGRLEHGTEEQRAKSEEVFANIERMADAIIRNAQQANQTAQIAGDAEAIAQDGTRAIDLTQQQMDTLVKGASQIGKVIHALATRIREIESVIDIIDDIAQRTNLLAVNANIEAVHAGALGIGFRVVAEEIRGLSEKTRFSTNQIDETVHAIRAEIERVQALIRENQKNISGGKKTAKQTQEVLNRIISTVDHATQMIRQIAVDSKAESTGAHDISASVKVIGEITRETAQGVASMAAAARELNAQTETLRNEISRFQLD